MEYREMPNIDQSLGIHEQALKLRAYRMELISSNLANADTPNYKAKDINFNELLNNYQTSVEMQGKGGAMSTSHPGHIGGSQAAGDMANVQYRHASQPSIDGNTVDTQIEKSAMMENSVHYQATLTFINGRLSSLTKALRGS
jgi:flagellar basal-body rod protein FlgB